MEHRLIKNKLILEFLGYKLASCRNGFAWESPHPRAIDDMFQVHGRLFNEQNTANNNYLKFDTSWEWLMPVAIYIAKKHGQDCIAKNFSKQEIFEAVVDYIQWNKVLNESIQKKVIPSDYVAFFDREQ